jgi:hypothetical protein
MLFVPQVWVGLKRTGLALVEWSSGPSQGLVRGLGPGLGSGLGSIYVFSFKF